MNEQEMSAALTKFANNNPPPFLMRLRLEAVRKEAGQSIEKCPACGSEDTSWSWMDEAGKSRHTCNDCDHLIENQ